LIYIIRIVINICFSSGVKISQAVEEHGIDDQGIDVQLSKGATGFSLSTVPDRLYD
jgi:hypothetical protein